MKGDPPAAGGKSAGERGVVGHVPGRVLIADRQHRLPAHRRALPVDDQAAASRPPRGVRRSVAIDEGRQQRRVQPPFARRVADEAGAGADQIGLGQPRRQRACDPARDGCPRRAIRPRRRAPTPGLAAAPTACRPSLAAAARPERRGRRFGGARSAVSSVEPSSTTMISSRSASERKPSRQGPMRAASSRAGTTTEIVPRTWRPWTAVDVAAGHAPAEPATARTRRPAPDRAAWPQRRLKSSWCGPTRLGSPAARRRHVIALTSRGRWDSDLLSDPLTLGRKSARPAG